MASLGFWLLVAFGFCLFFSRLGIRYLCWLLVAFASFCWLLLASGGFWLLAFVSLLAFGGFSWLLAFGGFWLLAFVSLLAFGGFSWLLAFGGFWLLFLLAFVWLLLGIFVGYVFFGVGYFFLFRALQGRKDGGKEGRKDGRTDGRKEGRKACAAVKKGSKSRRAEQIQT